MLPLFNGLWPLNKATRFTDGSLLSISYLLLLFKRSSPLLNALCSNVFWVRATFSFPFPFFFTCAILNPEFAVAIYCGLKIFAATLVYCFETPVLLTGAQRETIGTCVPLLFHPKGEIKLPVARVVVYDTILLLNIFINMSASQNRSNCPFRCGFLCLATMSTTKSGLKNCFSYVNGEFVRS